MTGINRQTGQPLSGFDHVLQSLEAIFSIPYGSLPLQRDFGLNWPIILGKLARRESILEFWTLSAVVLSFEEPRFALMRFLPGKNNAEAFRSGEISFVMEGLYRPRAQLGDMTSEGVIRVGLSGGENGLSLTRI